MGTPQSGIFALGTASHAYLEFDVMDKGAADELVIAVASLREPRTTMGGGNLVAGFRPELWRAVGPDDAPEIVGFDRDQVGADGYEMPATQHDAVLWGTGLASKRRASEGVDEQKSSFAAWVACKHVANIQGITRH